MSQETVTRSIKGTRTEQCLVLAYVSESTAYSRYTFYSTQATKENYFPIAKIFDDTAANELRHAKIFFKYLQGGGVEIPATVSAGTIGDTASNLRQAIAGEKEEGVEQYLAAAEIATEEGFIEIASHFREIAKIERHHEERFRRYLKQVETGTVWKRDKPIKWRCLVCGFEYTGTEPPAKCPACDHPREHYMSTEPEDC
ncbi:MAG: rubrerythrin family protein [Muribaculaceae bacterium]|nr:rubrerythrin family protein [Muribaculaceae bacterium]